MSKNILEINEIKTKKESEFTKRQLLTSKKYQHQTDLLNAILEDRSYTIDEVDKLINDFMKKKVNN